MSLPGDLLEQARMLATNDRRRPRQANLRRSISAAYYALFHTLTSSGTAVLAGRSPARRAHRQLVARKFEHSTAFRVSQAVINGTPWVHGAGITMPFEIQVVAAAFVELQQERHSADYDTEARFSRARAIEAIELAELASAAWNSINDSDAGRFYLLALLLGPPRGR